MPPKLMLLNCAAVTAITAIAAMQPVWAQQPDSPATAVTVDPDGTAHIPSVALPFSSLASPEAKKAYLDIVARPYPIDISHSYPVTANVQESRRAMDARVYVPLLERYKALYPVNIESRVIEGVRTDVITPKQGVPPRNEDRILINLHGGGFMIGGGGLSGQAESMPFASLGGFKVVTIDYRLFPEYKFPAASEDVAAVYKELLKHYKAKNIGIYGAAAGGILTGQAIAWFQRHDLPRPGAIGIICASAGGFGQGDSGILWPLNPTQVPSASRVAGTIMSTGYLAGTNPRDPLVAPVYSPEVLRAFPPTLITTSTRAAELSAAAYTDVELTKVGVDPELHVWDGLGLCGYFNTPDLPENKEANDIIVRFFDKHLGR